MPKTRRSAERRGSRRPKPRTAAPAEATPTPGAAWAAAPPRAPHKRRLRVFAFDPATATELGRDPLHELVLEVPWEGLDGLGGEPLGPGPVGEMVEVVDVDPASGLFYPPVDLDHPHLLAQDGLAPSTADPQFHQQMVYAVAMRTIRLFEQALGRRALWSDRVMHGAQGSRRRRFVRRLRIYPHAFRAPNAYYSPSKVALLFGYFPAGGDAEGRGVAPGSLVFTCLSYDIVAHETTHALLDGLHPRYAEPSNPDMLAFHEAFADAVAIFQHFTHREVLEYVIAETGGELDQESELAFLAGEMGRALGYGDALRSALMRRGRQLSEVEEAHDRGSVLVAALFDAFLAIYRKRTEDLLRIATGGSGLLPPGRLQGDLVRRLAEEAQKSAEHLLRMAIRALDYCPPVDLDFGDYLRALITADRDLVPVDARNYRLALIEAFRERGILARGVRNLSEESLLWTAPRQPLAEAHTTAMFQELESAKVKIQVDELAALWTLTTDRATIWEAARALRGKLHGVLASLPADWAREELHLVMQPVQQAGIFTDARGVPTTEVHSARVARRRGPGDESMVDLVVEVTQRRRGFEDPDLQRRVDSGEVPVPPGGADFLVRTGCTLLVDLVNRRVRYAIRSRHTIDDDVGLEVPRQTRSAGHEREVAFDARREAFSGRTAPLDPTAASEPFAIVHGRTRGPGTRGPGTPPAQGGV